MSHPLTDDTSSASARGGNVKGRPWHVMGVLVLLAASCSAQRPSAGLRVEAGAEEVGARLFVDGRYAGTVQPEYWVKPSPFDTIGLQATHRRQEIDSSSFTGGLDATVRGGKGRRLLFVGAHGETVQTVTDLGDSSEIILSFAIRLLRANPVYKPSRPPGDDAEGSDEGYHDELVDTLARAVVKTAASARAGSPESARGASRKPK